MRVAEAEWISRRLSELPRAEVSPLINIGSSTAEFRERTQPHIDRLVFAPLRAAGVRVIHTDLKHAPGVDVAGDLADPQLQTRLRELGPTALLSSNLLEHVPDPGHIARTLTALVPAGGLLIVTVPRSYPYHVDPIDNGFRPTPTELAALFPGTRLIRGDIVEDSSYLAELWEQPIRRSLRQLLGGLRPRGDGGRSQRDRLRWLFRPFSTSCVVLRREPIPA